MSQGLGRARVGSRLNSLSASRVLTVGDGSTLEGVAWTKPREVLGVWWDRLVLWDTDRQADRQSANIVIKNLVTVNIILSLASRGGGHQEAPPDLLFSLSSVSAG